MYGNHIHGYDLFLVYWNVLPRVLSAVLLNCSSDLSAKRISVNREFQQIVTSSLLIFDVPSCFYNTYRIVDLSGTAIHSSIALCL